MTARPILTLADLPRGHEGVVARLDLPEGDARRLMELGFVPGHRVVFARRSPFGDPRVYQIDGAEVALRRDTALHIVLREIEGDAVLQEVEADVAVRQ